MSDSDKQHAAGGCAGFLCRLWTGLCRPSARYSVLALLAAGIAMGVIGVAAFNGVMHATSTEAFCAEACHEMASTVTGEFRGTVHDVNRTGVRATCADCHIPRDFAGKMLTKLKSAKEIWGHFAGIIDTPEKFEKHRKAMAENEWNRLRGNDSQECRNCHLAAKMGAESENPFARRIHEQGRADGQTCIECHKGIAHKLPE